MLKPSDRPDYSYWKTPWQSRKRPDEEEMARILEELEAYSLSRFPLGRRFKLAKKYHSVPKDTCCTVVSVWPTTSVRWDKWANTGMGSRRSVHNLLFELDMNLEAL